MLSAVSTASFAADKLLRLEAVQQTRDPWCLLDHPLRNFQGRQALIASSAKNPQHVVLLQRDAVRLYHPRGIPTDDVGRPDERKNGFLGRRPKWTCLP